MRVIIINLMVRNLLKKVFIDLFVYLFVFNLNCPSVAGQSRLNTSLLLKTVLKERLTRQKNII